MLSVCVVLKPAEKVDWGSATEAEKSPDKTLFSKWAY